MNLQLRSTVSNQGRLELSIVEAAMPEPGAGDVIVKVQASPVNPSDLAVLLAGADLATAEFSGSSERPFVTAEIPPRARSSLGARLGQAITAGNEGAGTVVSAGSAPEAQRLLGRTVAALGGEMFSQFRKVRARDCMTFHDGTTAREAASAFVNPLTAQAMIETMRSQGHTALIHTAAASNLGTVLNRLCLADGVELVNVVRRREHAEMLLEAGARHVCVSTDDMFETSLADAIAATGATLGFDAVGGGKLATQMLAAMEQALVRKSGGNGVYGSPVHKQVYIYGSLDRSPTQIDRNFGLIWGVGGWLLTPFLQSAGPEIVARLRRRVADEITTTFASAYSGELSLADALRPDAFNSYTRQASGAKFLINPSL